jgi:uncharacterized protein (TIGR02118 family)
MIKLIVGLKKLPHLSQAEFLRFWLEEHGPIVRRNAPARRIRRYVQLHSAAGEALNGIVERRGGTVMAFDGVAELWWDSLADMLAAGKSPEGQKAAVEIVEHETQFLQLPSLQFYLGEEHVFVGG